MKRNLAALLTITIILLASSACDSPLEYATVTRVIDGDTIVLDNGETVRYIGMDTPEIHPEAEPFGIEAYNANRFLVEGKKVTLEKDTSETDKYGRLLRYVYVDDKLINAELISLGLAKAKAYPPDTKNQIYFESLEDVARETERGMWSP